MNVNEIASIVPFQIQVFFKLSIFFVANSFIFGHTVHNVFTAYKKSTNKSRQKSAIMMRLRFAARL